MPLDDVSLDLEIANTKTMLHALAEVLYPHGGFDEKGLLIQLLRNQLAMMTVINESESD